MRVASKHLWANIVTNLWQEQEALVQPLRRQQLHAYRGRVLLADAHCCVKDTASTIQALSVRGGVLTVCVQQLVHQSKAALEQWAAAAEEHLHMSLAPATALAHHSPHLLGRLTNLHMSTAQHS
jgi:hypothetical protein